MWSRSLKCVRTAQHGQPSRRNPDVCVYFHSCFLFVCGQQKEGTDSKEALFLMEQMLCLSVENVYPGRNTLPICRGPVRGLLRLQSMRPDSSSSRPVAQRGRVGLAGGPRPRTHPRNSAISPEREVQPGCSPFHLVSRVPALLFASRMRVIVTWLSTASPT